MIIGKKSTICYKYSMNTTKHKPLLKHLSEFEQVLSSYTPSQKSLEILQRLPLVLLIGPTASGRNTLIGILLETGEYHSIISDTTRAKRMNNGVMERDGVEYWFKTEEEVLAGLRRGEYLEAAIIHGQQVSGQNISQLEAAHKEGRIAVNEVQINGAAVVHSLKPNTLIIFLLPPTFDIWMQRLRGRGDVDEDELRRRLESAVVEITTALNTDYYQFVINNEIHHAAHAVDELAHGRPVDEEKQAHGRIHAEQLLQDVRRFLQR